MVLPGAVLDAITFPASRGEDMRAALARPHGDGPFPALIVIHEIFGLNDNIRGIIARFAENGYVALAPDLYDGGGPKPLCVLRAMRELGSAKGRTFDDLETARVWLAARPDVDASRLGVVGFCSGGSFAILYAVRAPVRVAAPFYAQVPKDDQALDGICPIVAGYGGRDRTLRRDAHRLARALTARDVAHDIKVYPEAGHGYMNRKRGIIPKVLSHGPLKVGYCPAEAEDSWQRVLEFFRVHLGSPAAP